MNRKARQKLQLVDHHQVVRGRQHHVQHIVHHADGRQAVVAAELLRQQPGQLGIRVDRRRGVQQRQHQVLRISPGDLPFVGQFQLDQQVLQRAVILDLGLPQDVQLLGVNDALFQQEPDNQR